MEFVEQLKSAVDIVEVVGRYVHPLRKAGPRYVGLCPFHTEKTPSFSVHAAHQFYKCFGCGAGGDVIKFVMEIEGLTFYEALKLLAERHGIPMPKRAEYSDPETKLRAAVFRMHELAVEVYRAALASSAGAEARAYLAKRGVAPAQVEQFELGFAEPSGNAVLRALEKEGFSAEQLEASGLVLKRQDGSGWYDRFRGRLMFPIHNESGKPIAFGGRALTSGQEPKYLNSPETPVYVKSRVLYNLHRAKEAIRKSNRAVLVEGYMDVIGVWAAGVHEVVASCGTALVAQQVRALKRHSDKIVVNFDPDAAGVNAAERSIQMLLEEGMRVRVLELEGDSDPDEYVKEHGADQYRQRLDKAPGYFNWLADRARGKFDMRTAEGRITGLQFLLPAIQRMPDKLERATVAAEVAGYLRIEPGTVLEQFRKMAADRRERPFTAPAGPALPEVERILLNTLLTSEAARAAIVPRLRAMQAIEQFAKRRVFQALFTMLEGGAPFRFADFEARLEDSDREFVSRLIFADENREGIYTLEEALRCLEALEIRERKGRIDGLRERIKQAERAGMLDEALGLMTELARLDRA